MDGTTEPIIAIMGHPIAGNPTQFALETGFNAAQIDCRFLSIDLPTGKTAAAVAGMDAMNFRGIWVTPSCRKAAASIVPNEQPMLMDFLRHTNAPAPDAAWTALSLKMQVWPAMVAQLLNRRSRRCGKLWWIDEQADLSVDPLLNEKNRLWDLLQTTKQECFSTLSVDQIKIVKHCDNVDRRGGIGLRSVEDTETRDDSNDVIIWARCQSMPPQWLPPAETVTIDLNENWDAAYLADWDRIKSAAPGNVLRGADVHAACLSKLTKLLFDRHIDPEVFQEAVDEYLAV